MQISIINIKYTIYLVTVGVLQQHYMSKSLAIFEILFMHEGKIHNFQKITNFNKIVTHYM